MTDNLTPEFPALPRPYEWLVEDDYQEPTRNFKIKNGKLRVSIVKRFTRYTYSSAGHYDRATLAPGHEGVPGETTLKKYFFSGTKDTVTISHEMDVAAKKTEVAPTKKAVEDAGVTVFKYFRELEDRKALLGIFPGRVQDAPVVEETEDA